MVDDCITTSGGGSSTCLCTIPRIEDHALALLKKLCLHSSRLATQLICWQPREHAHATTIAGGK
jgi:hypothetical protein